MSGRALDALLGGAVRTRAQGHRGWTLRLLSAQETLEARREAAELAADQREWALCANACLLARALERGEEPVFESGAAVLAGLQAAEIAALAQQWAQFNRAENPSPEDAEERVDALKKAWSTRLMSAFNGACSGPLACFRGRKRPGR